MGIPTSWNRLIRFLSTSDGGHVLYGEPVGDISLDVGLAFKEGKLKARVIEGNPLYGGEVTERIVVVKELLSPLAPEDIGAARCLGVNYEPLGKKPDLPILFFKPQTTLSHPNTPIRIPKVAQDQSDYENELVIVIGKTCKDVSPQNALNYVIGYTLCNDITARKNMLTGLQWGLGKGHDTWLPIGPCIVSTSSIPDPQRVQLRTFVNGEKRQDDSTAKQLYTVRETIAHLSAGTTLPPGAIICTGSPDGFGTRFNPPKFLKDGDEIRCNGDHGLGTLINTVEFEEGELLLSKL